MSDSFEQMDESLKDGLKPAKITVPELLLSNFSESVTQKIREREHLSLQPKAPAFLPWLVPTFAVLVLASAIAIRQSVTPEQVAQGTTQAIGLTANVVTLADEVAALRELGVWTEEDDASAEI